jgi:hypothetical protein
MKAEMLADDADTRRQRIWLHTGMEQHLMMAPVQ